MPELTPDLDDTAILEATAAADVDDPVEPVAVDEGGAGAAVSHDVDLAEPSDRPIPDAAPRVDAIPRPVVPGPRANGQLGRPHPPPPNGHPPLTTGEPAGPDALERTATAPQLRRFIKSRAYVPMHELRRRFVINGGDDDVTPIDLEQERIYVGLPAREGSLLGELFRAGDIGYELSMDPIAPIVVGVYPMRPVPRG